MAASLSRRGFAPNSTYASALNYHSPYNASQAHTAIYVGVGYVSQNYTARLARTTGALRASLIARCFPRSARPAALNVRRTTR